MRSLIVVLAAAAVMALAFWAYRENYRTQAELAEIRDLQREIGQLRESLGVLRAEWAYLNRPDRLRELADINFERLGLLPLDPRQFGGIAEVRYPAVALPPITDPIDTVALGEVAQ
ncbi:cell division protein FtsL [Defluviimonas sp. WL0050]|uniref:Cell division protein FtsL n=1 Tax=Albidovulum litorale TaxID=2984134 RepID=A0ABT2ZJZ3_9RHOB|nr:cell division protein FtsL [Defluviimonas sp. WL0050]MCV2871431.1 cell division protein FtsL [Defluviimonas sp. WL0050]